MRRIGDRVEQLYMSRKAHGLVLHGARLCSNALYGKLGRERRVNETATVFGTCMIINMPMAYSLCRCHGREPRNGCNRQGA